jgi:ABC-type transporter MlaC component
MRKDKIKDYILDIITNEDDLDFDKKSKVEKVYFLHRRFLDEYFDSYNQNKYKGNQRRAFASYLAGMPSCINIDYLTENILKLGKNWYNLSTEKKEDDFVDAFFQTVANIFIDMVEGLIKL